MQHVWIIHDHDRLGERTVRLDGTTARVVALAVRPGVADYYNLTVSQLHTYAMGAGQFVVHNCGGSVPPDPSELKDAGTAVKAPHRGGGNVPKYGEPKSYVRSSSGKHSWVYDENGELQWDISTKRAKPFEWNVNPDTGERFPRALRPDEIPTPAEWLKLF